MIDPLLLQLIGKMYPQQLAAELCNVQPITKETIGDPTRGYENIFTITYKDRMYEQKQYMEWENEGGK